MSQVQYIVLPPSNYAAGQTPFGIGGKQGEQIASELHGKFYTANYNNKLFKALATGFTNPAIAATLAAKFAFVNPQGSGVNAEIVSTNIELVVEVAAVTDVAWYWQNIVTNVPTSPTAITPVGGIIGSTVLPQCVVYSALTAASGTTPVLADLLASFQWVTAQATSNFGSLEKFHDGRIIVPPGIGLFLAGAVAGPASGMAAQVDWLEWPI
jgi:hypothetical protein